MYAHCFCLHRTRTIQPRFRDTKEFRVHQTSLSSHPSHSIPETRWPTCTPRTHNHKDIMACRLSDLLRILFTGIAGLVCRSDVSCNLVHPRSVSSRTVGDVLCDIPAVICYSLYSMKINLCVPRRTIRGPGCGAAGRVRCMHRFLANSLGTNDGGTSPAIGPVGRQSLAKIGVVFTGTPHLLPDNSIRFCKSPLPSCGCLRSKETPLPPRETTHRIHVISILGLTLLVMDLFIALP